MSGGPVDVAHRRRGSGGGGQGVVGEEDVVAQPGQAGAPRLVLVGHQVAARDARGEGGDVGQRVRLLERDVATDPARGADVEMAVEVGHGARADGGRVQVTRAGHDRRAGEQAELGGGGRVEAAQHAAGRDQLGQRGPLQAGQRHQRVVVGHGVDVTVVRHPVQGDGVVRGAGQAGEAQAQVVDRLEEDGGGGVDLGPLLTQEVDVADRVLARQARDAAGAAHPLGQLGGGVALHVDRAADGLTDGAGAAGVHPGDGRTDGGPVVVDGHGPRPLRRAAHADDVPGRHSGVGQGPAGRTDDGIPPGLRGLLGATIVGQINSRPPGRRGPRPGRWTPKQPPSDHPSPGRRPGREGRWIRSGGARWPSSHGDERRRWAWLRSVQSKAGPFPGRLPMLLCPTRSVTRPGRPRSRSRSRPCCPPRRCRRAASG